ncbi:PQ loop repeat-domain-containing protein [Schizophyllum amplum]|uniref:PQ loop repeat-domain-containing protein n=1 Tax=Schizophyllum amplum TaxID=97359 RepID=A0A550C7M5_9AGAR|nr:PQ loop repeat-domain-containing protein [Auriculariopsis ampla]
MPANAAAENALGTMGVVCWCIQLAPQIWKSYHEKSTKGLSPWLAFLWTISAPFLGTYCIVQKLNIPLILQPQLFGVLCSISWGQCLYYTPGTYSRKRTVLITVGLLAIMAGFEAGMVYAIRPAYEGGNMAPVRFFGIMSSVIISVALLPQYWEIYKHKEVIGISIPFMLIDLLGGVFSDLSLAFAPKFDVIAGVTYSLVVLLDGLVILAALILNPLARRRRRREQAERDAEELVGRATHSAGRATDSAQRPVDERNTDGRMMDERTTDQRAGSAAPAANQAEKRPSGERGSLSNGATRFPVVDVEKQ